LNTLQEKIKKLAEEFHSENIGHRRHLHAYPEPSFEEFETSKYIQKQLDQLGIPFQIMADTGVIGLIKGHKPSDEVIALRADMDALPIHEKNEVEYVSKNIGYMHACGHDAHTASLLGAAKILNSLKAEFGGTIKLIFQPGEEKVPGGASLLIAEGVLENPKPEAVLGQHVAPQIPVGKVGFRPGKYMASADELFVYVHGKGGHGAMPDLNIDPVLIASHIIVALQQIISRNANPKMPSVLSFGRVIAEGATNVIPDQVYIEGTFRTLDETWRASALGKMKKMAELMAEGMGGSCDFQIKKGFPALVNDEALTHRLKKEAQNYLGEENVIDLDLWMASEDFAFYSQIAPSCFYRLGTRNDDKGITSSVHTPTFNIDEEALKIGPGLMSYLALKQLGN